MTDQLLLIITIINNQQWFDLCVNVSLQSKSTRLVTWCRIDEVSWACWQASSGWGWGWSHVNVQAVVAPSFRPI